MSDLRLPDLVDDSCDPKIRGARLRYLISQNWMPCGDEISLVAWDAAKNCWCAWLDKAPTPPLSPAQDAYPDPLKQADILIGPRPDEPNPPAR